MASITINGTLTLDESAGLQNATATPAIAGDANDNDVALTALQSGAPSLYARLFGVGGLGLDPAFAAENGVARSASNFIAVSGTGSITSLGFVLPDGDDAGTEPDPLPVWGAGVDPLTGGTTTMTALDGGAIHLFADAVLGNRLVLGVDATGDVVLAIYMDASADLTSATVWMVQFEPISNPVGTNPDDAVSLLDSLDVAATEALEFGFDALPSGQNLFGMVGNADTGLIVIGRDPVLKADGTYTNASNTINTSQGGGPTTIGVDNQMFDPGDGAYFTFVRNPVPAYLAGAPDGLDQGEADDADNILYTGGTLEVSSSFTRISQVQGSGSVAMKVSAFDIDDAPAGQTFVESLGTGDPVAITAVRVYNAAGLKIEDTGDSANYDSPTVSVVLQADGSAVISGIGAKFKVEWDTAAPHDQVLIEGQAGKFDIGGFGSTQSTATATPVGGSLVFEDSGPTISASLAGAPLLSVDETVLTTDDAESFAGQFTADLGTDGGAMPAVSYALTTAGGASGLYDSETGTAVYMFQDGAAVVGRVGNDPAGDVVFRVTVTTGGSVGLDQQRAVLHSPDTGPNQSTGLSGTNLVVLTATAVDGDTDSDPAPLDITSRLAFLDDAPDVSATASTTMLTDSDADLGTDASASYAGQFDVDYGHDGPAAAASLSYAVGTPGGASGLVDTGTGYGVFLFDEGDTVVGRAGMTAMSAAGGPVVFVVTVDQSGEVTLDQRRAVAHADPESTAEYAGLTGTNLVVLTATATDRDDDSDDATVDLTALLRFGDDGPAIGTIANGIVDFAAGSSVTNTLGGDRGNDLKDATGTIYYTIESFTPTVMADGVELTGLRSANGTSVTYFADANGNGLFEATEVKYYDLTLEQTANANAGAYTFTVYQDPPPSTLEFNFDALPSGQNLFGMVGDAEDGLIVFARGAAYDASGHMTNASATINTSQGGGPTTIGVNNQMFNPGEGAYFTFVQDPDTRYLAGAPDGLDQNEADYATNMLYGSTLEVNSGFTRISQLQGGGLATMKVTAFDLSQDWQDGNLIANSGTVGGTQVAIGSVRVYNAAGIKVEDTADLANYNSATVAVTIVDGVATVSGLGARFKVEWDTGSAQHDQVLIEGAAGKFDIGAFGTTERMPTPDQVLEFVVRATDGDGDHDLSEPFYVGIDGTLMYDDGQVTFPDATIIA
jgi:hypothetical protein